MFNYLYKLKGTVPVACRSVGEWQREFLNTDNTVRHTRLSIGGRVVEVKTEFTGFNFGDNQFFQTLISDGFFKGEIISHSRTYKEAMHKHSFGVHLLLDEMKLFN